MAPLPLTKLAGLLIKAVTKPVAKRFKAEAGTNERFRGICRGTGRAVHFLTGNLNNFMAGKFAVTPISDSAAVSLGAEVLGEGIVVAVAAGVVLYEYQRSNASKAAAEARKLAKRAAYDQSLADRFAKLELRLQHLEQVLEANEVVISNPASGGDEDGASMVVLYGDAGPQADDDDVGSNEDGTPHGTPATADGTASNASTVPDRTPFSLSEWLSSWLPAPDGAQTLEPPSSDAESDVGGSPPPENDPSVRAHGDRGVQPPKCDAESQECAPEQSSSACAAKADEESQP